MERWVPGGGVAERGARKLSTWQEGAVTQRRLRKVMSLSLSLTHTHIGTPDHATAQTTECGSATAQTTECGSATAQTTECGSTLNLKPQCRDLRGAHNRNHVSGHPELEKKPT